MITIRRNAISYCSVETGSERRMATIEMPTKRRLKQTRKGTAIWPAPFSARLATDRDPSPVSAALRAPLLRATARLGPTVPAFISCCYLERGSIAAVRSLRRCQRQVAKLELLAKLQHSFMCTTNAYTPAFVANRCWQKIFNNNEGQYLRCSERTQGQDVGEVNFIICRHVRASRTTYLDDLYEAGM